MTAQALLDAHDAAEVLAAQAAQPLVRAVRHKPGGASSPAGFVAGERSLMSGSTWRSGYALLGELGLHFDLQTDWWNLPEASVLAADFPDTLIIIDHAGSLRDRDPETVSGWRSALESIARFPNVVVKASGLCVVGQGWTVDLNRGPVLDLVRIFGAERVMFGSNFPVDGLFCTYAELVEGLREITETLTAGEQREFFFGTAQRVYGPEPFSSDDVGSGISPAR